MKIYRYEKNDGGGPFCTFNGILRTDPNYEMNDPYLYGCSSLDGLNSYFKNYPEVLVGCTLKIYEVPDNEVFIDERQVVFPKKYSPYY